MTFSNELWIEADDFMEEPPKKYNRLFPGNEVRIKGAYVVRCTGCVKDADGNVTEVLCEYDPETRGGNTPDGRKVRGTIHWVDAHNCADAEVRLYDNLFADADPEGDGKDYLECLNPDSLSVLTGCKVERMLAGAEARQRSSFCASATSPWTTRILRPDTWSLTAPSHSRTASRKPECKYL